MSMADVYSGRDTDADWRRLGEADPYWAVLNAPQFRRGVMLAHDHDSFFETGRDDVGRFARMIAAFTGEAPRGGRGLDFGCGVGRLTEAMADHVDQAYGYDISDGMVNEARARSGRPVYGTLLPEGPFDWINSHIVFQHIPPPKGMALLVQLLERLAPGGAVSLQFAFEPYGQAAIDTAWRRSLEARTPPPPLREPGPPPAPRAPGLWTWTRWVVAVLIDPDTAPPRPRTPDAPTAAERALPPGSAPLGHISMYAYDLPAVLAAFREHGIADVALYATDHGDPSGGWRGYTLVGRRRGAAPTSPASE